MALNSQSIAQALHGFPSTQAKPLQQLFEAVASDAADKQAATQADSVATDAAGLVTDFNALLAKLKAAGLMA